MDEGGLRITDFGLALSHDDATGRSETAGTPAYMAPEQIGKAEASVRSDIYSLGVVFHELFTAAPSLSGDLNVTCREDSPPKSLFFLLAVTG